MEYTDIQCVEETINGCDCRLLLRKEGGKPLIVVGLNPSTADETVTDATIRKIMGFITNWNQIGTRGYDSFIILNLYPLRETSPVVLDKMYSFSEIVHKRNMEIISSVLNENQEGDVLLCYGDSVDSVSWLKYCRDEILKLLASYTHLSLFSLGNLTNKKNPRHPCRLAYKTDLKKFHNPFK